MSNDVVKAQAVTIGKPIEGINYEPLRIQANAIDRLNATNNRLEKSAQKNLLQIAYRLGEIKDGAMFKADGFKSVSDFATKTFGYKSNMVAKMVKASKRIVADKAIEDGQEIYTCYSMWANGDADFSLTQLFELATVDEDTITNMLSDGVIDYSSTCAEIRNVVKSLKSGNDAKESIDESDTKSVNDSASNDNATTDSDKPNSDIVVSTGDNPNSNVDAIKGMDWRKLDADTLIAFATCALSEITNRRNTKAGKAMFSKDDYKAFSDVLNILA